MTRKTETGMIQRPDRPVCGEQNVSLLLLSGGVGARSGHIEPKQFYELGGHPMIAHSIIAAVREPRISEIVTNAPEGFEARVRQIMDSYCCAKPYKIAPAGKTRQDSCRELVQAATNEVVIVHEAARPFVNEQTFANLINDAEPNLCYVHPIAFSMCNVEMETGYISDGVDRAKVFDIQLPQKFGRSTLMRAHEVAQTAGLNFTEDAVMVVKMAGEAVKTLTGSSRNWKVTTNEDLFLAGKSFERNDD